jgi:hypothetical protein
MVGRVQRVYNDYGGVELDPAWGHDIEFFKFLDKDAPEVQQETNAPILFLPSRDGVFRPVVMRKMGFRCR